MKPQLMTISALFLQRIRDLLGPCDMQLILVPLPSRSLGTKQKAE